MGRLTVGGSFIEITGTGITLQGPDIWENCDNPTPSPKVHQDRRQPKPPKGANAGTSPNGGEMAKPMPSKKGTGGGGGGSGSGSQTPSQPNSVMSSSPNEASADNFLKDGTLVAAAGGSLPMKGTHDRHIIPAGNATDMVNKFEIALDKYGKGNRTQEDWNNLQRQLSDANKAVDKEKKSCRSTLFKNKITGP